MNKNLFRWMLPAILVFGACKKDDKVNNSNNNNNNTAQPDKRGGEYILSEGGFGQNNAKLCYRVDSSGVMSTDYFLQQNPSQSGGLGDLANDMIIYGGKIYIVMNGSGNITILKLSDGTLLNTIPVPAGPRYAVGHNGKLYVTAYDGTVKVVDTTALAISNSIPVGPNPEGIVAVGNYLYVANSGGLNPVPDSTVSVVDINTEAETQKITACLNPQKIEANSIGELYVTSYGNFSTIPPAIAILSSATKTRIQTLSTTEYSYDHIRIFNDTAYMYNNYGGGGTAKMYNTLTHTTIRNEFITDGTAVSVPYGINIDPENGDVYIADAKDFVSGGEVFCFDRNGTKKFSFSVSPGVNPNKIIFLRY
ncbi:MAG: hypothetical protein JST81_12500 [Bacteroidetes bacterium]|nr:hypothetical protein [Bacteroidota bacterium]